MFISNRSGFRAAEVCVCAFLSIVTLTYPGTYSGGSGTAEDPYKISTAADWQELIATSADWDKHFVLLNDIDFGGMNLTPVAPDMDSTEGNGFQGTSFSGIFDGNGHTISGFARSDCWWDDEIGWVCHAEYVGLFGKNLGTIRNLGVLNCYIGGDRYVGCLTAENEGTIRNCFSTGSASGGDIVGGLVGFNGGMIINCYSKVNVRGRYAVGGLVGVFIGGTICSCYSTGPVVGYADYYGGLVGDCNDYLNILNSFWDTQTSGEPHGGGGGTGKTTAEMKTRSTFTSAGWDFVYSDGSPPVWKMPANGYPALFWEFRYSGGSGTAEDPYKISTAADWQELIATSADWDKHFVLLNDIDFGGMNLTPVAPDQYPDDWSFYGVPFRGMFDGKGFTLRNVIIQLAGKEYVGLFGEVQRPGVIQDLHVSNIQVEGNYCVGGLIASNNGTISQCHITGQVHGNMVTGGLVGNSDTWGAITSCSSMASVSGTEGVGGLAGGNGGGTISECFSSGAVSGESLVGGLVGTGYGRALNCYSTADVSGTSFVGGLAAIFEGTLFNCFSTGRIYGSGNGMANSSNTVVINAYWDTEASGFTSSGIGMGRTTQQMKKADTFLGWNSCGQTIWTINEGQDYPHFVWEGKPGIPLPAHSLSEFLSGDGSTDHPYLIHTAVELDIVGQFSCQWDRHFRLMSDLDLSGFADTGFHMIGGDDRMPFTGNFDGQDHIISHFRGGGGGSNQGLFRSIGTTGHIWNLKLESTEVSGTWYTGSLTGSNLGYIQNCVSTNGKITGTSFYTGGLVGANFGTIEYCSSDGTVSGSGYDGGGLVGDNYGMISRCLSQGLVLGFGEAGGLAGSSHAGKVSDCFSTVSVSGKGATGGLVGEMYGGTVSRCYSIGSVSKFAGGLVGTNYEGKGVIRNSFWDIEISGKTTSDGGTGKTTAEMKMLSTFTSAGWDFTDSDGTLPVWMMLENEYPSLWPQRYSGGNGTAEEPFAISTVADWQELIATSADWDKQFILLNDIDFGGANLIPVAWYAGPIGDEDEFEGTPFTGVLDGKGFILRNAVINRPENDYVGLFACLGSGSQIRNLGLDNIAVTGRYYVGNLCGGTGYRRVPGGTISNCYATGEVNGQDTTGGLCGSNGGGWPLAGGRISNCYATGTVSGGDCVGGLCGRNDGEITASYATGSVSGTEDDMGGLCGVNSGMIRSCYATGPVSGYHSGGLVGLNGVWGISDTTITSCYATGEIHGSTSGGLCGFNQKSTISDCYATGSVNGHLYAGGLCGYNDEGTFDACFWNIETSGLTNPLGEGDSSGITGKTTAEMKTLSTFTEAGWDFVDESVNGAADVWRMCENGVEYPRLSWEFSGSGDFDCPDGVALEDLLYLAERWMANTPETVGTADADNDGKVDLADFAIVGENWMK